VDTISSQHGGQRRRRRLHSDEFKADAVAACTQPGVSMAAVALSRGVNANLLRRWVREAELHTPKAPMIEERPEVTAAPQASAPFIPLQLPAPVTKEIRVELRRGPTTVSVTWPAEAAGECALWIRELLR
jgi:transposase